VFGIDKKMTHHDLPIRIYYEDTDAGGIIYHAKYLKFAERARTELLRACGYENLALQKDPGILFVVRHAENDYLKPGFLDDMLEMQSSISTMKNSSFIMQQDLIRPKDQTILCRMKITLVCVSVDALRPVRIPENIRTKFETYMDDTEN
jgi:acyl-CoA thioester hydrolase